MREKLAPGRCAALIALVLASACVSTEGPVVDLHLDPEAAAASAGSGSIGAAASSAPEHERAALAAINSEENIARARGRYGPLEFLGEATIVSGFEFEDSIVGGLSGITWVGGNEYLVVSDDRGDHGPGRFYTLRVDLDEGRLDRDGVELVRWTPVLDEDGDPLTPQTFDLEGIAWAPDGTLYISSEGEARAEIPPFVDHLREDGTHLDWVDLPAKLVPDGTGEVGVRPNLALESLAVTPDGRYLFTATENALQQDGPAADHLSASPSRIYKIDLTSGSTVGEYVYVVDRLSVSVDLGDVFHTSGLVDLVALDGQNLLALERSFVAGAGFVERIHWVSLEQAANVLGLESLSSTDLSALSTARKELLLDLTQLGIQLDNLEGMALGASLPDGRRCLILIGDNNFNETAQITQILAFAVPAELEPPSR